MVKLPKHKMAKQVNKRVKTAKHKGSSEKARRLQKKMEKGSGMDVEDESKLKEVTPPLTEEEKLLAKLERKKKNKSELLYKKQILNRTGKNGPRSINGKAL